MKDSCPFCNKKLRYDKLESLWYCCIPGCTIWFSYSTIEKQAYFNLCENDFGKQEKDTVFSAASLEEAIEKVSKLKAFL